MTTEAELLAAVTAHPDDDAPRIALAKLWGGAHERYVLGQLNTYAAARAGTPDPDAIAIRQLVAGKERAWAGPIADRVLAWHFVRGFPEWIVVDAARFAREWQELEKLAPIRHLDPVHAGSDAASAALFQSPGLAQLVSLSFNITGPHFDPVDGNIVMPLVNSPHLGKLRFLDLRRTKLTIDDKVLVAMATNMPALECLLFDDLEETIGTDYDGSIQSGYPNAALVAFEKQFGPARALHYTERTHRIPVRDYF